VCRVDVDVDVAWVSALYDARGVTTA